MAFVLQTVPREVVLESTTDLQGGSGPPDHSSEEAERRTQKAMESTLPRGAGSSDVLHSIVEQLSLCHTEELKRLKSWTGLKKQLAIYRSAYAHALH